MGKPRFEADSVIPPGGRLKLFFSYYGGKYRLAPRYPQPRYQTIIEPFAGSAGYSVRYPDRKVRLYDKDPVIVGLWQYLIRSTPEDILSIPVGINHVDDVKQCQEARWLVGFWLNRAASRPMLTPAAWMRDASRRGTYWDAEVRQRIASQVDRIKHWKAKEASYETIDNEEATWFVDPPYEGKAGKHYQCKFDAFSELADWCRGRKGQVIVCEMEGASWLPFVPFREALASNSSGATRHYKEVIWTNDQSTEGVIQNG